MFTMNSRLFTHRQRPLLRTIKGWMQKDLGIA